MLSNIHCGYVGLYAGFSEWILFGLAAIAAGVKSVIRREAKFSWSDDADEQRIVEGFPAILVGIA